MIKLDTYLVSSTSFMGYWGKGATVQEAIQKAKWFKAGEDVLVYRVSAEAAVNPFGGVCGDSLLVATAKVTARGGLSNVKLAEEL